MGSKERQLSYSIAFKIEVVNILYEESDASSENNHEDDFSGSDDDFLGFYDE